MFAGGAALYFLRPPAKVEVVNDVNGELINLYRVLQHHREEFVRQFKWALTSRQVFEWLKQTTPETLTDNPACCEVLLPAEKLLWREAGGANFRDANRTSAGPEPAAA